MKALIYIVVSLALIMLVLQVVIARSVSKTEQHRYEILKQYDGFEVRRYDPAVFTEVALQGGSYRANSGNGFRILAGYIFGGNDRGESIAMTSPVVMQLGTNGAERMRFMVPSDYRPDDLPKPNHPGITFETTDSMIVAALTFGGWADDENIAGYCKTLGDLLEAEGIQHEGKFSYLGYNPPYEVVNRRNEVVVTLIDFRGH